jgi:sporulation protein YlmC with PRC-barrel domain
MRLSGFINLTVLDADGGELGRLHEIRAVDGEVRELVYGSAGLFERMTGRAQPTTIPWSQVERVTAKAIRLK